MSGSLDDRVVEPPPSDGTGGPVPPRCRPDPEHRRAPKSIPVFFRRSRNRLVHITLLIANRPGSLRAVLAELPDEGVNLLALNISGGARATAVQAQIFAEIGPPASPRALEQRLGAISEVYEVRIEEDVDGRLIDGSYPVQLSEADRALLFSAPAFSEAWNRLRDNLGSGGAVLLCVFGEYLGRELAADAIRAVGREFIRSNLAYSLRFWSSMGWGQADLGEIDLSEGRITVRVFDSFECDPRSASSAPRSQLIRGVLIGMFSRIIETPLSCEETACRSQGSPYCEFVLERRPPESLEAPLLPG